MLWRHLVICGALVVSIACSSNAPSSDGCSSNDDCKSGEICDAGQCEQLCSADSDCGDGSICVGSLCQVGTRADAPTIDHIDGDGSVVCPDADGSHCVEAGLVVNGTFLEGAAFALVAQGGASHTLVPRLGGTEARVELDLPSDVATGVHTLVVTNGAGSADQAFEFIQGPTGPQGPAGSPDTAEEILTKLQTVDGAGSGLDADTLDGVQMAAIQAQLDALAVVPVGTVVPFAAATPPSGWLICDGAAVSRTEYADLFAVIGVTHGGGNLVDTFHLPDLRGRFVRGVDEGAGNDPDAASRTAPQTGGGTGDAVGSVQADEVGVHNHPNTYGRVHRCDGGSAGTADTYWDGSCTYPTQTYTKDWTGSESRPKNVYLTYIIKY